MCPEKKTIKKRKSTKTNILPNYKHYYLCIWKDFYFRPKSILTSVETWKIHE